MYSGWLLTNNSGNILGAHQKFNRAAYKGLNQLDPANQLPPLKLIQHFEGRNGPDGLKTKSPGRDEPHHFYDPFDPDYTDLLKHLRNHYNHLRRALKVADNERAAYEAAWLAHALTDGLTPAHHYPYEEEVSNLRDTNLTKVSHKFILRGNSLQEFLGKNWDFWGAKGLFITHGLFECGVAMVIAPLALSKAQPSQYYLKLLKQVGPIEIFCRRAREIAHHDMYSRFYRRGWTRSLAGDVRRILAPTITEMIILAWYSANQQIPAGR